MSQTVSATVRSNDQHLAWPRSKLRGLNHVGAVGFNGKIYCIGGFVEQNNSAVTDVSVYDPVSDKWQRLAPLVVPLGSASVAVLDGKIHAVGGHRMSIICFPGSAIENRDSCRIE